MQTGVILAPTEALPIEGYIKLGKANRFVPGGAHANTPRRWSLTGVLVDGRRIRLRVVRVGGKMFTRKEWIDDFIAALNTRTSITTIAKRLRWPVCGRREAGLLGSA